MSGDYRWVDSEPGNITDVDWEFNRCFCQVHDYRPEDELVVLQDRFPHCQIEKVCDLVLPRVTSLFGKVSTIFISCYGALYSVSHGDGAEEQILYTYLGHFFPYPSPEADQWIRDLATDRKKTDPRARLNTRCFIGPRGPHRADEIFDLVIAHYDQVLVRDHTKHSISELADVIFRNGSDPEPGVS